MNFENNIRPITNKYVSQYVGTPLAELGNIYDKHQEKQDTAINSRNELLDSIESASALLHPEDREMFKQYAGNKVGELQKISREEYVGNLDTKLRNDASKFKAIYGQLKENSTRREKFDEALAGSDLGADTQQLYMQYAQKMNGKSTFDPITGSLSHKFVAPSILKDPDAHTYVAELDGLVDKVKGRYYVNPITGKTNNFQLEGYTHKVDTENKQISPQKEVEIRDRIKGGYRKTYDRDLELGGKEYADKKQNNFENSVLSALKVGTSSSSVSELTDVAKDDIKEAHKTTRESQKQKKEQTDMDALAGVESVIYRRHDLDNIGAINSKALQLQEKGDTTNANNIIAYRDRIDKKYGLKYGVDYTSYSVAGKQGYHVINDNKKHLIELANADIQKDAMPVTQLNQNYVFTKAEEQNTLNRHLSDNLANLSTDEWGDDKMTAMYHPTDAHTGEPLTKVQMAKLKNITFSAMQLTPDGIIYSGRSNSSNKDQNENDSTDSDFKFHIKMPNQESILKGLVNSGKVEPKVAHAYQLTQGLTSNYGNSKTIKIHGKPDLIIKQFLPSDDDGKGISDDEGVKHSKSGFGIWLKGHGFVKSVPDYKSLLDTITEQL
jgi:hypothetical protein